MGDARLQERVLTLKTAIIMPHDGVPLECAILNVSRSGACLLVQRGVVVPEQFELKVDFLNLSCSCSVAWRAGHKVGVAFCNRLTDREHMSLAWVER